MGLIVRNPVLTLSIRETPKQELLQTVMTKMKCSIILHSLGSALFAKVKKIF